MINSIKNNLKKIGVDKAIFYTSLSRVIQSLGGLVSILLIASFMSKEEQGFYYTFASVLAIQIFFELGLGGIITQFVAHEMAHLSIDNSGKIGGNELNYSRLTSLIHFCIKWYSVLTLALFSSLLIVGITFFSKYGTTTNSITWQIPWILISLGGSLSFLISPWMAVMHGFGKVKEMSRIALIQQIIVIVITWSSLALGAKLYTTAINAITSFLVLVFFYWKYDYYKIILNIYRNRIKEKVSYWNEIFPYQWKIGLSWISSYFIFQLFNPLTFAIGGASLAGQMGMTLTALNAILALTLSWTSTKIPSWATFTANKDYQSLDKSFYRAVYDSSIVCIVLIFIFILFIFILKKTEIGLASRFLPLGLCAILSLSIPLTNIINAWATYLRCHKKEPFLIQAIIVGLSCAIAMYFATKLYGINGTIIGYTSVIVFISLPISYYIFIYNKKKYKQSI